MQVSGKCNFLHQVFLGDTVENKFSDVTTSKRLGKVHKKKGQMQVFFVNSLASNSEE